MICCFMNLSGLKCPVVIISLTFPFDVTLINLIPSLAVGTSTDLDVFGEPNKNGCVDPAESSLHG